MDSSSALPGDLIANPKITHALLEAARNGSQAEPAVFKELLRECGCPDPDALFEDLRAGGLLYGSQATTATSNRGYKTLLFLSGALGTPTAAVFDEFRSIEPALNRYELVREGMTARFIRGLLNEPTFRRLYICSPWINIQKKDLSRLVTALDLAAKANGGIQPEILVLVQTPKIPEIKKGLEILRSLGAKIVEKPTLHSKLYMREPGAQGGLSLAIVGSENLTRQKWIELGIEIRNDGHIFSRLRSYFFDVFGSRSGERTK